jgi:hypothetical protein
LNVQRVDSRYGHPKTDLLGVYAAHRICGAGCPLKRLVKHILKTNTIALKAIRIHIGNIVTNYIHPGLMILKPGNTRKQRSHHIS